MPRQSHSYAEVLSPDSKGGADNQNSRKLANSSLVQSLHRIDTVHAITITFSQTNWDCFLDTEKAASDGDITAQSDD
jgi:hypothetical protein